MAAKYLLRLDDISRNMNWDGYNQLKPALLKHGVRPLIGVIPDNRDPSLLQFPASHADFWDEVRSVQRLGWEICMHGYQHLSVTRSPGMLGIHPRSEFAGLSYDEQLRKLRRAKGILDAQGISVKTFMAPWHSFDRATLRALCAIGLAWVTDGYGLFPYRDNGLLFVPQLLVNPRKMPWGVFTWCLHLNTMTSSRINSIIRFIERYHDDLISFEEATRLATNGILNSFSKLLTRVALTQRRKFHKLAGKLPRGQPSG